ncbi:hypothetical protein AB837_00044 [bacterium AB1]|nr:hypothetical protein AB837_00044 [bacterium AB1]
MENNKPIHLYQNTNNFFRLSLLYGIHAPINNLLDYSEYKMGNFDIYLFLYRNLYFAFNNQLSATLFSVSDFSLGYFFNYFFKPLNKKTALKSNIFNQLAYKFNCKNSNIQISAVGLNCSFGIPIFYMHKKTKYNNFSYNNDYVSFHTYVQRLYITITFKIYNIYVGFNIGLKILFNTQSQLNFLKNNNISLYTGINFSY